MNIETRTPPDPRSPRTGWLLLDVDGVLNPECHPNKPPPGAESYRYFPQDGTWLPSREAKRRYNTRTLRESSLLVRLHPGTGEMLYALAEQHRLTLAWATTWGDEANRVIALAVGLTELPVVPFTHDLDPTADDPWRTDGTWKYAGVSTFCGPDEPVVWLDDGFAAKHTRREAAARREWLNARRAPTLLHQVDPRTGIVESDLTAVTEWAHQHAAHTRP